MNYKNLLLSILGLILVVFLIVIFIFPQDKELPEGAVVCNQNQRNVDFCTEEFIPVCGYFNDSRTEIFSNSCFARIY